MREDGTIYNPAVERQEKLVAKRRRFIESMAAQGKLHDYLVRDPSDVFGPKEIERLQDINREALEKRNRERERAEDRRELTALTNQILEEEAAAEQAERHKKAETEARRRLGR